ncbi:MULTISPECIES: FAD-dependent monooxygenase [Ramlibacter]|uniref:FAD-dependent monooxygenase n=1 Tax=Ramlibacter aquaticus TaxID=2780094 RepID=A0ABR9SC17_9BURK|nr:MULTISPECIES: FAD-dependent monooxygenase [Ramlibacter]MBE7939893.1 FAD-dependent monooxygenase [Ramlibacter aquaticus]
MHQPTTEPRASIYYDYRIHQPWLPTAHPRDARKPVVIVGAGPAGLVAALGLAAHGVPSVVLSAELQVSQGSRAIVFTRRSMEILHQAGVARRVVENGLPWRFGNSFYRGQRVFRMEAPHEEDNRFFPMNNIQQQYLEEYLLDACAASPLVDLRWGNKLERLEQDDKIATLTVDTPAGAYTLQADWVVAADGGRSGLRSQLGLQMEGASYEGFFVIADIRIDLPLPTERLAFFDPPWNPGNTILMHREPQGIWRVDYQLPPGETPEEALRPESLKQRIDAQLAMIGHAGAPWEMDWCSVYSARTLTLPDFRHGRVLFTGDAAHLLPIFGVRGANTAFQDSQSLAWHLAFVAKGLAGESLLANFSAERVGAAREIIEEAGKSTRFMTPPSRGFMLLRNAVLSLSLTQDFVRPLYHWRTSRPHEYSGSALNSPGDDNALFRCGPAHGAPPQDVRLGPDDHLLDHLGPGFTLLYAAAGEALPAALRDALATQRARGVPLKVIAVGQPGPVAGADACVADAQGRLRERYGMATPGAAYLLRPDQHVCARWVTLDAQRLAAAFVAALPQ